MAYPCNCNHLKARHELRVTMPNHMNCPVCEKDVPVEWVLNSILDQLKDLKEKVNEITQSQGKTAQAKIAKGRKAKDGDA